MKKPNILYIHSHDTGRFIQPYGHAISTPRLQKLAEEGVLFRKAFTPNPTCSPSRACLLSGQTAHSNSMLGLAHRGFSMDYSKHLVRTLKKNGYFTALAGIQHVAKSEAGISVAEQVIGYDRELTSDHTAAHSKAVEFLKQPREHPFFLSVGLYETHRVFPKDHPHDDPRYILPPAPLPDTPEVREDMARFKQSARILDDKVGQVLDVLEETGLADNTIVICTTDHGIAFPRMKCNLEDSGTGVMLIMRGPGGFSGGRIVDSMISQIDLFPTLCDCLDIKKPDWLQGTSFMPIIREETDSVNDELFFEINYHAAFEPLRAVRTDRYKYIVRYDPRNAPVLPNCDDGISKQVWLKSGWANRVPVDEALYDLMFDPNEMCNLADKTEHASTLKEMRAHLLRWQQETHDPLIISGDIPLPENAMCNDRDSVSPDDELLPKGLR